MTPPLDTQQAIKRAAEATDTEELLTLYQQFSQSMPVVNAIVQNKLCPDEIKKQFVLYMLEERLPVYATEIPNGHEMLTAMRKSLDAWQPVQRLAPTPDIDRHDIETMELYDVAQRQRAIILYGPPGTSKTFLARIIAKALTNGEDHRTEFVQFHASYNYEDFIEGIVPKPHKNSIIFDTDDKVFKEFCARAGKQVSQRFVFIIDEINRADLSKVFGEVFTGLEYRGQPVHLLYSREPFLIPSNVVIIGTMNTIDRSTHDLDFALRRRFFFFQVSPSADKLVQVLTDNGRIQVDEEFKEALVEAFLRTQAIYPLGHAYFKNVAGPETLQELWKHQLQPLLEQYFEFEKPKVREIERLYSPLWESAE